MTLLDVRQLITGWQRPAHRPVSFSVERGRIVALVGPSGAGKSTLLSAMITSGAQIFSGHLQKEPEIRIGFLPQQLPSVEGLPLSGRELLLLTGASPQGLPFWLTSALSQRLDKLSGGQRQFLALWSILHSDADLLLLDEPGNHLDKAGLAALPETLRTRARQGAGIIFVTHDQKLVEDCNDALVNVENHDD